MEEVLAILFTLSFYPFLDHLLEWEIREIDELIPPMGDRRNTVFFKMWLQEIILDSSISAWNSDDADGLKTSNRPTGVR